MALVTWVPSDLLTQFKNQLFIICGPVCPVNYHCNIKQLSKCSSQFPCVTKLLIPTLVTNNKPRRRNPNTSFHSKPDESLEICKRTYNLYLSTLEIHTYHVLNLSKIHKSQDSPHLTRSKRHLRSQNLIKQNICLFLA